MVKDFNQLGQAAYEAFQKEHVRDRTSQAIAPFASLAPEQKECWLAVARQLYAEFAALH